MALEHDHSTGAEAGGFVARTFVALKERDYAWYFAGNMAFFLAMQVNMIVRGYLAYDLSGAATALGVMGLGFAIPLLVVAPFGGVIADRVNKRSLLIVLQTLSMLVNVVMAVLILTGNIALWHLIAAAFATGTLMSLVMPARQALIPQLVPQHLLMNAISLQMGGMNLTRIIGPALGGMLIAPLGVGGVYLLTVTLFIIAVASLFPLPRHGMVANEGRAQSFLRELAGGFSFVAASPLFRMLIATALLMPLFAFPVQQILPVFADDVFGDSTGLVLGLLMSATGVGGLIGAVFSAHVTEYQHKGRLMFAGAVAMCVCYAAFALTPLLAAAIVLLVVGSLGSMLFQVTNNTVIQARVPDEFRGRVMSVMMMSFGTMPLGIIPITMAADAWGAPIAIAVSQAIGLGAVLAMFAFSGSLRRLSMDQLAYAELSPAQAARLVAEGTLSHEEAALLTGRVPAMAVATRASAKDEHEAAG